MPDGASPGARWLAALALICVAGCTNAGGGANSATTSGDAAQEARCLAGHYHGAAMEIAAALELGPNHRFRYRLIYGALDETAEGKWEPGDGALLLTSDPIIPPAFAFVSEGPSPDSDLHIDLDVPQGISRQYFDAELGLADGSTVTYQFAEDGLVVTEPGHAHPAQVRLLLPVFSVASAAQPVTGQGARALRFRFDPNDLGKVAFTETPLEIGPGSLLLERHGRALRLLRQEGDCQAR